MRSKDYDDVVRNIPSFVAKFKTTADHLDQYGDVVIPKGVLVELDSYGSIRYAVEGRVRRYRAYPSKLEFLYYMNTTTGETVR